MPAQILTDTIFTLYGGQTGTSSSTQRDIAYQIGEGQMEEYLHTFLVPTTVTETYFWGSGNPLVLKQGNIITVGTVVFSSVDGANSCEVDTATGCHAIRGDGKYGYIDVTYLTSCGGCSGLVSPPYNVAVTYTSGLPSGTAYQPEVLQALTLAAQINLNEIDVSLSNEGTGDVGIQSFSNQSYSEQRTRLGTTAFGNSAIAQRIARLVRKFRSRPSIGFH
jgi:hypothetical protein